MKTYILITLVLSLTSLCYASTYCIYNNDTKEVYSLSNQDDAVVPEKGYTKIILKEDMKDLDLIYPHSFYKYQNKALITNRSKLDEEAKKEEVSRAKAIEEQAIQEELRAMAKERIANKTESK